MNLQWHKMVSFALLVAALLAATASLAGSDRWLMAITEDKMERYGLVHVSFTDPSGAVLESDALKAMEIRAGGCDGQLFQVTHDYKFGYRPADKQVGIYLFPQSWAKRDLCFRVPGVGQVETSFPDADAGKTSTVSF